MRRFLLVMGLCALALSCGQNGGKKAAAPLHRDFPAVEVPMMMEDPAARIAWLSAHFWDRFTAPEPDWTADTSLVNGVKKEDLDKQMSVWLTLMQELPWQEGVKDVARLYEQLEAFQLAHPGCNVLPEVTALVSHYLYDPNSPYRNEDLYLPYVQRLAQSELIDSTFRMRYEWDARMCSLNRRETPAADFVFIDTQGKKRTLYSVKAEYVLLIFGNPDCTACRELVQEMEVDSEAEVLIQNGRLKVVDVYIDQDIEDWKARIDSYPASWINGYDPTFTIRTDLIYSVRAIPSIYILDRDKKVLLKDAPQEQVIEFLNSIEQ